MEGKWYEKKEGTKRNQLFILSGKTLLENQTKFPEKDGGRVQISNSAFKHDFHQSTQIKTINFSL